MLGLPQWPIRAQENLKAKGEEPMRVLKKTWKPPEMRENDGTVTTVTFNKRDQVYRRHANATALSSSPGLRVGRTGF